MNNQQAMQERERMALEAFERISNAALDNYGNHNSFYQTHNEIAGARKDIEILRAELGFNKGKS